MQPRCRFTSEFKVRLVLDVLTGVQSQAEACRKHSLSPNLLANWKSTSWSERISSSRPRCLRPLSSPGSPSWNVYWDG